MWKKAQLGWTLSIDMEHRDQVETERLEKKAISNNLLYCSSRSLIVVIFVIGTQ